MRGFEGSCGAPSYTGSEYRCKAHSSLFKAPQRKKMHFARLALIITSCLAANEQQNLVALAETKLVQIEETKRLTL